MNPKLYIVFGLLFAAVALVLSLQTSRAPVFGTGEPGFYDIAADGGALGFGIAAGCCFLASAVVKRKE